jgi:hypothetical protein
VHIVTLGLQFRAKAKSFQRPFPSFGVEKEIPNAVLLVKNTIDHPTQAPKGSAHPHSPLVFRVKVG